MRFIEIAIAALIAALVLTIIHLLAMWGNKHLERLSKPPISYVVGVAILGIPYCILLRYWGEILAIYAFVGIVAAGGAPVITGYILKKFRVLLKENEILRGELDESHRGQRLGVTTGTVERRSRKPPWSDRVA